MWKMHISRIRPFHKSRNPDVWAGRTIEVGFVQKRQRFQHHHITSNLCRSFPFIALLSIHTFCSIPDKQKKRNEETRQHSNKTKIYSRLKAVTHSNDVVKCKTLIIPCAGGTDRRTMQMKSHIRLNSIFLDVTILPFLCRNSECVL